MWRLKRGGEWYGPKWPEYVDAWIHLLRSQGQSTHYATTHGGWDIVRCSPLIRTGKRRMRCGCGVYECPGVWRGE
jgi:hypothetical protein